MHKTAPRESELNFSVQLPGTSSIGEGASGWNTPNVRERPEAGRQRGRLALQVAADEGLDLFTGEVVVELLRRGLHEVARRGDQRAADAAVQADLGGADGVDDHAGGVGRVPNFELVFQGHRGVAEVAALQADEGPLAVIEPLDVVGRADVDVLGGELGLDVGGDGLGLGDLLGLQAVALEHVLEVHVAADVQLVRAVQGDAAVLEQLGHDAVRDGGTDLALDVIAHDRHARGGELVRPLLGAGQEDRQGVDERHAGIDRALGVELGGLLGADRQVADHDVNLGVLEGLDDVDRLLRGLLDGLEVVLAQAVQGVAALDGDAGRRDVGNLDGVVFAGQDGVGQVLPHLLAVDVERSNELDVADVVLAELHVHQARDRGLGVGIFVVLDALDQRSGAVTYADDCNTNRM